MAITSASLIQLLKSSPRHVRHRCLLSTSAMVTDSTSATDTPPSSACACPSPCTNKCPTLLHIDRHHVLHPYTSMIDPLPTFPVSSASGVHLSLADGRRVIDGMSSWWAALHGYRHPELDEAIKKQAQDMSHVMFGGLTHRPAVELACRLLQMANNDYSTEAEEGDNCLERLANNTTPYHFTKVFFSDSGSISIEVALKMSIQYWFTIGQQAKTKFISLRNGYHGDTFGAMSICDPVGGMHSMFGGILAQQFFVKSPSGPREVDAIETLAELQTMLQNHSHEVAAVVMEPIVQGAGGMKFHHPIVLKRAMELCKEYNVLLIFDEIATGFGRTGALFAGWHDEVSYRPWSSLHDGGHDWTERDECNKGGRGSIVYPDIVCLGKALTGGYMTLGATLTTDKVAHGISGKGLPFMHGPTFMANPLACSVALASLKLIQKSPWEERVNNVRQKLIQHLSPLSDLSSVAEVRALGAIGVCELKESLSRAQLALVQQTLVEEGVWLRPFGKLLYTMPPFNCEELEEDHLKMIGDAIYNVASKL